MNSPEKLFARQDVPANDDSGRPEEFFSAPFYDHTERMIRYLTSLQRADASAYTPKDIQIRLERMVEAKDSELYAWVMHADERDWKSHPSFYHALIKQLQSRRIITK